MPMEIVTVIIDENLNGQRLDKALHLAAPQFSRARLQALLDEGQVTRGDKVMTTASAKVKAGEVYTVSVPPAIDAIPIPQDIALDIIYEDDDLLVINKAPDMVVHPAAGNEDGTLVNALLAYCGDRLSGIGGVKRPGIVHRLDKETSGLMVVAKNDIAHRDLSEQLSSRSLKRQYAAVVWGLPSPVSGHIETQIGRSPHDRQKMAVLHSGGKEAITDYDMTRNFGIVASLVECRLQTGRTHQIRVHMAHLGHPLVGDPVYGKKTAPKFLKLNKVDEVLSQKLLHFPRQALHAQRLEFIHPISKDRKSFETPLPADMAELLAALKKGTRP